MKKSVLVLILVSLILIISLSFVSAVSFTPSEETNSNYAKIYTMNVLKGESISKDVRLVFDSTNVVITRVKVDQKTDVDRNTAPEFAKGDIIDERNYGEGYFVFRFNPNPSSGDPLKLDRNVDLVLSVIITYNDNYGKEHTAPQTYLIHVISLGPPVVCIPDGSEEFCSISCDNGGSI